MKVDIEVLSYFIISSLTKFAIKCMGVGVERLKVTVEYLGHLRVMLNKRFEEVEVGEGTRLSQLLGMLAEKYGEPFKKEVYDPGGEDVKSGFLVTVNRMLLNQLGGVNIVLKQGDHVTIMAFMSGG